MKILLLLAFALSSALSAFAEDWTTTDGKTYSDVKVIKSDDTTVTILTQDGPVAVPLSTLAPEIQKRFRPAGVAASAHEPSEADQQAAKAKAARLAIFVHGLVTYKGSDGALLIDCNAPQIPNPSFNQSFPAGQVYNNPFSNYQKTVNSTSNDIAAQGRHAFGTVFLLGVSPNIRRGDTIGITAYPAGRYTDKAGTFRAYTTTPP